MGRLRTWTLGICLAAAALCCGQKFPTKGVPLLQHYPPETYDRAGKAWDIASAPNGLVYFATDKGLLEFDGQQWQRFSGSRGFTRSVLIESDSVLYSGSDKDFGRWQRTPQGSFTFTSLYPFRDSNDGLNEEFWATYKIKDYPVFVSFDNIYVYAEAQLTKIAAPHRFTGSCASGELIYLFDELDGLFAFDGLSLKPVVRFPPSSGQTPRIVGVQETGNGLLIVTRNQGLFRFATGQLTAVDAPINPYLQQDQVFSFTPVDGTHYAFGTVLNGIYISDLAGNITQHINRQKGLLNNTILAAHYSPQGKLWLSMDFGISSVQLWSGVAYFLDVPGKVGTGHTGLLHGGIFYLGTNQGLYYADWEMLNNRAALPAFKLLAGSSGQVWDLRIIDGKVLGGHDRGLFQLNGETLEWLGSQEGTLGILKIAEGQLLAGTYNGIALFEKINGAWQYVRKIAPIQGACSALLLEDAETLWINLPNYGLLRASLDQDLGVEAQKIFPAAQFNNETIHLQKTDGAIQAITTGAVYTFQQAEMDFSKGPAPAQTVHIKNPLAGTLYPTPLDSVYGFFPVYNGFALINRKFRAEPAVIPPLSIRRVVAFNNDTTQILAEGDEIPHYLNHLRANFSVPQQDRVSYQYTLDPISDQWSDWAETTEAEFVNLAAGAYTLRVRANGPEGQLSEATFSFSVGGPWHTSYWAYLLYAVVFFLLLGLNHLWQSRKLREQSRQLQVRDKVNARLQAAAEEKNNLLKKYAQLEEALSEIKKQLRGKTIELARKAKESDEKGRVLQILKEKLDSLTQQTPAIKFQLTQLSRVLDNYEETEDNSFSLQMEELHQDFLNRLSERFPELTHYDLRLCVYLKSGLSTREIAELMNVLASSVNVSRSRLRKKLDLGTKDDLYKFLNSVE
ncbi:triple tyrosine motif-containing protein [Neolewinella lacunae]|uniref:HTH luxR-type domain-containing protein n=1 Tax=Neolewinella lacunae TaxID=1517758 RepID=A0A923PFV5_9BACT|nr:triple tyrosine motif-containing protein [Neolewinella lacunae]MBC6993368.1 hypothetical protein [Neolewinella lacunae]MDN3635174.1 triple tyrosine motif-containing protein [Neolewinella lacunae]